MDLGVIFGCRARDSRCVGAWLGLGYICLDFNDFRGNLHLAGHIPDDGDKNDRSCRATSKLYKLSRSFCALQTQMSGSRISSTLHSVRIYYQRLTYMLLC